jgi:hypothetical protein
MCKKLMFLISFVTVLVLVNSGLAADYTWTGTSPYSQLWVDPLNWNPLGGPGPGDTAKLEVGYAGQAPVHIVDNSVGEIKGPGFDGGDMTLEIVGGWLQVGGRWEMADTGGSGRSDVNIGVTSPGWGDPCVHIGGGFRAFTDGDAEGDVYFRIGGNSYVEVSGDHFEVYRDNDAKGYFELRVKDTATLNLGDDDRRIRLDDDGAEDGVTAIYIEDNATVTASQLRFSDKATGYCWIGDDANVSIRSEFKVGDEGGLSETVITGNAFLEVWDGRFNIGDDGAAMTIVTIDSNAVVELAEDFRIRNRDGGTDSDVTIRGNASVDIGQNFLVVDDEGSATVTMMDCPGPHVVVAGDLQLPNDDDCTWAQFNLHGGLIEVGGMTHEGDNWNLDICNCGVMVIDGNVVAEIMEDYLAGNITVCGRYLGCGAAYELAVDYNHPDFPGDRTKVWVIHDPYQTYDPDPECCTDPQAEDVQPDLCLTWTAGDSPCPPPIRFWVFLSTDYDKVADGNLSSVSKTFAWAQRTTGASMRHASATRQ